MFGLGMGELIVILIVALIVLGPSKLPKLAQDLGKAIREFKKAADDVKQELTADEELRRPFQELHEAVTLSPEELKARDEARKRLEAQKALDPAAPVGRGAPSAEEAERLARADADAVVAKAREAAASIPPPPIPPPDPVGGGAPTGSAGRGGGLPPPVKKG